MENMTPRSPWPPGIPPLPSPHPLSTPSPRRQSSTNTSGSPGGLLPGSALPALSQCSAKPPQSHSILWSSLVSASGFSSSAVSASHLYSHLVSEGCRATVYLAQTEGKISVSVCIPQTSGFPCDRMVTLLAPYSLQSKRVQNQRVFPKVFSPFNRLIHRGADWRSPGQRWGQTGARGFFS